MANASGRLGVDILKKTSAITAMDIATGGGNCATEG